MTDEQLALLKQAAADLQGPCSPGDQCWPADECSTHVRAKGVVDDLLPVVLAEIERLRS